MGWNSTCISWGHLGAGSGWVEGHLFLCGVVGFSCRCPTISPVISFPLLLLPDASFPSSASNIASVLVLAIVEQLVWNLELLLKF